MRTCGNRLIQVLGSMAMVQSSNSDSLILQQTLDTTSRLPVELDIVDLAIPVDEAESVDTEPFHVPVVLGDAHIVEEPSEGVEALWVMRAEVEDPPVLLDV